MSEKLGRDEKILNLVVKLGAVGIILLFLGMGFFDKSSFVYNDLHPFTILDGIGVTLLLGFAGFISGFFGQFLTMRSRQIGWAAWGAGVLGILLIIA